MGVASAQGYGIGCQLQPTVTDRIGVHFPVHNARGFTPVEAHYIGDPTYCYAVVAEL